MCGQLFIRFRYVILFRDFFPPNFICLFYFAVVVVSFGRQRGMRALVSDCIFECVAAAVLAVGSFNTNLHINKCIIRIDKY